MDNIHRPRETWSEFYCNGWFVTGPDRSMLRQATALTVIPFIAFIALMYALYADHVSDTNRI